MTEPSTFILCGGSEKPGPRDTDCPHSCHDYPLPAGYVDAHETAAHRLYKKWRSTKCPKCGIYGWIPPLGGPR